MAYRPLAGYPQQVGAKYELFVDIDGLASYVNTGTFNTSGQQVNVADLGFGGIEYAEVDSLSSDGVNAVQLVLGATTAGATNLNPGPTNPPGPAAQSLVLHWYTTPSSATEVSNTTNLSAKYIRLHLRLV
jgi:hypothetical protein